MSEPTVSSSHEPRPPRMQLVDLFILVGSAAMGMALGRAALQHELPNGPIKAAPLFFGMVVPSLFGGLAVGHPTLMLWHSVTGRRRRSALTYGEGIGLVPAVSLAITASVLLLCWGIETVLERPIASLYLVGGTLVVFALTNLAVSLAAAIHLVNKAVDMAWGPWTDLLGTLAALLPGATIVLLFLTAMLAA